MCGGWCRSVYAVSVTPSRSRARRWVGVGWVCRRGRRDAGRGGGAGGGGGGGGEDGGEAIASEADDIAGERGEIAEQSVKAVHRQRFAICRVGTFVGGVNRHGIRTPF